MEAPRCSTRGRRGVRNESHPGRAERGREPGVAVVYVSTSPRSGASSTGRSAPIVLYCNGPFCGKSKRFARAPTPDTERAPISARNPGVARARRRHAGGARRCSGRPRRADGRVDRREGGRRVQDREHRGARNLPRSGPCRGRMWAKSRGEGRRALPMDDHNTRIIVFGATTAQAGPWPRRSPARPSTTCPSSTATSSSSGPSRDPSRRRLGALDWRSRRSSARPNCSAPTGCIAVVLAVADARVGAGREQQARTLDAAAECREVERRHFGVPVHPARVGVGAVVEQPSEGRGVAALGEQVERAAAAEQIGVVANEAGDCVPVTQRKAGDEGCQSSARAHACASPAPDSSATVSRRIASLTGRSASIELAYAATGSRAPSMASGSAPSSRSSAAMAGRSRSTANCSGVR